MTGITGPLTDEQQSQAAIATHDIIETVNRLLREGIHPELVIAGIAAAASDTITSVYGAGVLARWFDSQATLVRQLQQPN